MKKVLALGLITAATLMLMGCQQAPAVTAPATTPTTPEASTQTTKASVTITEPQTQTSKASLEILPSTQTTVTDPATPEA